MARHAFLFGAAGKQAGALVPLKYTSNDVHAMQNAFLSPAAQYDCCMAEDNCSPGEVVAQFESIAEGCKSGDTLLFYFTGHGFMRRGQFYLVCNGTDLNAPVSTAIPIGLIKTIFANTKASVRMMILDCCHSGAAAEPVFAKSGAVELAEPLTETARTSASLILAACGRTTVTREIPELKQGFLTHMIVEAMTSQFSSADFDHDRLLSINDLIEWIAKRTDELNRQKTLSEPIERPELYGEMRGDVYLTIYPLGDPSDLQSQLLEKLDDAVEKLRKAFEEYDCVEVPMLQRLARPIKGIAPTLLHLDFLKDMFRKGDDASIFAAAVILNERRDPRYMNLLITRIDASKAEMRDEANWRILRAVLNTLPSYELTDEAKQDLIGRINRAARIRKTTTTHGKMFAKGTTLHMIHRICKRMKIDNKEVFTRSQIKALREELSPK